jgi:hypothetical protein
VYCVAYVATPAVNGGLFGGLDAGDAGGARVAAGEGRRGSRVGGGGGGLGSGGHVGGNVLDLDILEGNAQHLAADEVGDVDVLGSWGRHGDGWWGSSGVVGVVVEQCRQDGMVSD